MKTPLVTFSLFPYAMCRNFKAYLIRLCLFWITLLGIGQTAVATSSAVHLLSDAYHTHSGVPIIAQLPYTEPFSLAAFFEAKSPKGNQMRHLFLEGRRFLEFHSLHRPLLGCKYTTLPSASPQTILSSLSGRALVWALSIITTN